MTQQNNPRFIPIWGFRHMYRSLMRFCLLDIRETNRLMYRLYVANVDTCQAHCLTPPITELSEFGFGNVLEPFARPYYTEVQLYRSMYGLLYNVDRSALTYESRAAVDRFGALVDQLAARFERIYDCDICSDRTTYSQCWKRLTVRDTEPKTPLRPELMV